MFEDHRTFRTKVFSNFLHPHKNSIWSRPLFIGITHEQYRRIIITHAQYASYGRKCRTQENQVMVKSLFLLILHLLASLLWICLPLNPYLKSASNNQARFDNLRDALRQSSWCTSTLYRILIRCPCFQIW